MPSPVRGNDHYKNGLSPGQNSVHKNAKLKSEDKGKKLTEVGQAGSHDVDTEVHIAQAKRDDGVKFKAGKEDMKHTAAKKTSKLALKKKKAPVKLNGRRYRLRSSLDGVRVLRSMSNAKKKTTIEPATNPVNSVRERRKTREKVKRALKDEYLATRKRLRYLLTRMNYEQNLLDAYSGEGWKGQSLEKIRPEKELERAKSEILRCKLKIRDLFHHIDSLLSDGRLLESLFDSEGQICSEDIFCAKCGSKDLSADNDIILCDGICDRGFHQKCLNPPLLSENIPPGDEGWLCPGCDCKVDCIDLLNEFQGSRLKIKNSWEKVFPEASAIANGDHQYDDPGLPSDDSEDNDYDPDVPEVDAEEQQEGSTSEEFDFTSSSEDLGNSKHNKDGQNFGFPSDDSEDDDYDPDKRDPHENIQKNESSLDESDFTSDSDDFCAELCKSSVANDGSASSLLEFKPLAEERSVGNKNKSSINSGLISFLEPDLKQDNAVLVSGKRQHEQLDYKKLYDETYGNTSSDSNDDEDWSQMSTPKKGKIDVTGKEYVISPKTSVQTDENLQALRRTKGKAVKNDTNSRPDLTQQQSFQTANHNISQRIDQKLDSGAVDHVVVEQKKCPEFNSNGKKATTFTRKNIGKITSEKLLEHFKEDQYPSRQKKESLAEELGLTVQKISKWFENARHNMRASVMVATQARISGTPNQIIGKNLSQEGIRTPERRLAEGTSQAAIEVQSRMVTPEGTTKNTSQATMTSPSKGAAGGASCAAVTTLDDGTKLARNQGNMGQNSSSNIDRRIKTGQAGNTNVGPRHTQDPRKEAMDVDRQKAIARELRKRRLSR